MNLIYFDQGVKGHLVPSGLGVHISQELFNRFGAVGGVSAPKRGEVFRFDAGPVYALGVDWVGVQIDETLIEVSVLDLGRLYLELLEAKPRSLPNGKAYYKVHGNNHCVVLTPEHRRIVLRAWSTALAQYRARQRQLQANEQAALALVRRPAKRVFN